MVTFGRVSDREDAAGTVVTSRCRMCWSAAYRLLMQCFGFAVAEVSTESLLIDQDRPAVRSDTDEHQPIDGRSLRMEGGGTGMVAQSVRQPMETAAASPSPEPDRPAAAATSYHMSPLLQPTAVSLGHRPA